MIDINDAQTLRRLYKQFKPVGSGPLGTMRVVFQLVEAIAAEKGIDLEPVPDLNLGLSFERTSIVTVRMSGAHVGDIKEVDLGYAYFPKGQKNHGRIFKTIVEVMENINGAS